MKESIVPDKICKNCGSLFYCKPSHEKRRNFCSKKCFYEKRKTESRHIVSCKNCGKEYEIQKSREKHNRGSVCSKECQYQLITKNAETNKILKICLNCKKEFKVPISLMNRKYCGVECRTKHMVGENNPLFLHGDGGDKRGPHWQKIKRDIRERDNYTCQKCGVNELELDSGLFLHVHHIIPYRFFDGNHTEANKESNLITLCPYCHRKEDAEIRKKELTNKVKGDKVKPMEKYTDKETSLIDLFQD